MKIHDYFYNEDTTLFSIDFSMDIDGDDYYRNLTQTLDVINYYSPEFISENELDEISDEFLIEFIENYIKSNKLPDQISL